MMTIGATLTESCQTRSAARRFARAEDGSLIVFSLFIILCMMLAGGVAYDVVRTEVTRTKIQNTLDRAVLAAADLNQSLEPEEVVMDYFAREGMADLVTDVTVSEGMNFRTVSASSELEMGTQFLKMVGIPTLTAPAAGEANETITDIEISLVLDNSGSMGWNSNYRLDLLKDAAKDFVESVIPDSDGVGEDRVSINIVPFAMQVNAGPDLLQHFNVTDEHTFSHCVEFEESDFSSASISTTSELQRAGHFDPWTHNSPIQEQHLVCPTDASRHITVKGTDKQALKDKIDSMWAGGNTSIELGTKWGLSLLTPEMRPVIQSMVDAGQIDDDFAGRPFDYGQENTLKVLIVMSDGENTSQYVLDPDWREGPSRYYKDTQDDGETWYHNRGGTSYDYYYVDGNQWRDEPWLNWSRAQQYTYPEIWAERAIRNFGRDVIEELYSNSSDDYLSAFTNTINPSTKNPRTSAICQAARDQGITVYTIGMDTYGQGDATLSDCASGPAYFFDVDALDIDQAFSALARAINRLRLTQ